MRIAVTLASFGLALSGPAIMLGVFTSGRKAQAVARAGAGVGLALALVGCAGCLFSAVWGLE